jgi:hypothetical protein
VDEWPSMLQLVVGLLGFFGALAACEVAIAIVRGSDGGSDE